MRVFHEFSQVEDSYYKVISSTIQSIGQTPLSQSIKIQNSTKSLLSNVDLMWTDGFWHGGQNNVPIEITYIPMLVFVSFCKVNVILFFNEQFSNGHQILVQGSLSFFQFGTPRFSYFRILSLLKYFYIKLPKFFYFKMHRLPRLFTLSYLSFLIYLGLLL